MKFRHFFSALIRNLLLSFDVSPIENVKNVWFSSKISCFWMQKCLVYLHFRVFNPALREWCSIVARLLQNRWKIVKKCENRARKTCEFCVQFVHVFLIWRLRWHLKIALIYTGAKSVISRHLRSKWRFGPPEFTFSRLFSGCRLFLALTFGEGTIGEGYS